jgi:hypothetical protein
LTKIHTLLGRRGVVVSYRTLHRYATTELDFGRRQSTVPVADCEPGAEVQVDFGRLGMLTDNSDGRRRVVHGLIFTASQIACHLPIPSPAAMRVVSRDVISAQSQTRVISRG